MKSEFSYYSLFLKYYLTEIGDSRRDDSSFIEERAAHAGEVFEESRRDGLNVFQAQERATEALIEGLPGYTSEKTGVSSVETAVISEETPFIHDYYPIDVG